MNTSPMLHRVDLVPPKSAWETCWKCQGSGHGMTMGGDPDGLCWECKGNGMVRARDDLGRFVGNSEGAA